MDGPRYHHYHDEDWWIHAKLHELPHVLKQLRKENRAERESLELEQQQYKMTARKPLSARNFSEDLPEIRFEPKSPFFLASKVCEVVIRSRPFRERVCDFIDFANPNESRP
jgi:hypothetical protein